MLEQTDIGSWVTETQTAIEDADALNVDRAYRLTLLGWASLMILMLLEKGGELNAVSYLQAHDRKRATPLAWQPSWMSFTLPTS